MGLEAGDLKRLVHPELHIDEFKSKLGDDKEICVITFKVGGKEPAQDLVNFIEKGYNWVVDADVSSGEMDDGDYIVFIEADRTKTIPEDIIAMMEDIMRLTEQELSDWRVRYLLSSTDHELTAEEIGALMPLTPEDYVARFGDGESDEDEEQKDAEDDEAKIQESLNKLRAVSGVKVTATAPVNDLTNYLRAAAGIK